MNPQLLATWLAELESGRHKKCHTDYRGNGGELCALGVLAKLNGWEFEPIKLDPKVFPSLSKDYNGKTTDSSRWPKEYGVNWPIPEIALRIMEFNNDKKKTFSDVARYIKSILV